MYNKIFVTTICFHRLYNNRDRNIFSTILVPSVFLSTSALLNSLTFQNTKWNQQTRLSDSACHERTRDNRKSLRETTGPWNETMVPSPSEKGGGGGGKENRNREMKGGRKSV